MALAKASGWFCQKSVDKIANILYNTTMEKITFGQFLAQCRTQKRLTQKELADKLFVSESAVSKWEKDKRRPDLELVTRLSEIFGITESELIRASIDNSRIKEKKQARSFRIIRSVYNHILYISFCIALLTCFIVNLAVSHTLSWFFIVLSSIVLAAVILLLPQYVKKYKLLIIPLSWLLSLYLLLGVICIYVSGNWFFIPAFALLLAYSIIFAPLLLKAHLPETLKKHYSIFAVTIDAVLLFFMLIVIDLYDGNAFGWSFAIGLPILLFWLVPTMAMVAILRYAKINWQFKTAGVTAFTIVAYNIFASFFMPLFVKTYNSWAFWQANLFDWSTDMLINANIVLLINIAVLVFVTILVVFGCVQGKKAKK